MTPLRRAPLTRLAALALASPLALALAAPTAAQDSERATAAGDAAPVERWTEWPRLKGSERSEVNKDIARLRKAETDEMAEQAREALVAAGGAIVPYLLPKLAKEDDEAALARMESVLLAVTGPEHTRLLAEELDDREEAVRVWAMRRVAAFPDPALREAAEAAWSELLAREGAQRNAPSEAELRACALLTASTGSLDGLDRILAVATEHWQDERELLTAALAGARGPEASARVLSLVGGGERERVVAALRMLRSCGDESAVPAIAEHLDSQDATVRKAAINALRGIVDGAEPLERLSVFEGIERAKAWKERL